jgi:hypothetical protein
MTLTGAGLGLTGLLVAAIAGAKSMSKTSDLKDACPNNVCPMERKGDYDSATHWASTADVAIVVGATGVALAITGVVIWQGETAAASRPQARAVVGPGTFALEGRF